MKLSSSNTHKIKEFRDVLGDFLEIVHGEDLKEVDGTIDEVITYKALHAGPGFVVEDTVLTVNGELWTDIRWRVKELKDNDHAVWTVSLGYNDGENIKVYRGETEGFVKIPRVIPEDAFAFDPYFVPKGRSENIYELMKMGLKHEYSARSKALLNLKNNIIHFDKTISEIPKWTGSWQNEELTK